MRVGCSLVTLVAAALAPLAGSQAAASVNQPPPLLPSVTLPRMSVLMVIVDDLRASLDGGPNGANLLQLPHLDALAKRGVAFARAYAQCALCAPSRSSVLVGVRPDTTRVLDLTTHFRAAMPSAVTLPQAFKVRCCCRVAPRCRCAVFKQAFKQLWRVGFGQKCGLGWRGGKKIRGAGGGAS